ncbi:LTA synthase family protein [Leifsonia sp. ZF2019]|uniref:LTA synthase family protein n=1 Tax=Leifsonia sp. ZF2019 TaxID=2781978 RepID=UPI001CBFC655|nr:LTA synthase family protein [Leifsonia sp. ZF2019]UAJ80279.1 LTA synthase family protein [Leifsonia sp. ZF2019]
MITVDQMVLNLAGGADGVTTGDTSLVDSFIVDGLLTPVLVVAASAGVYAGLIALTRRAAKRQPKRSSTPSTTKSATGWRALALSLSIFLVVGTAPALANQVSLTQTIAAQASTDSLSDVYRDPADVTAPETKRNLVTIYLESMEPTFADATLFGRNLLAPLDSVTGDGWTQIDSLAQGDGLGWTMAGIVATQCGIPIKSASGGASAEAADEGGTGANGEEVFNEIGANAEHYIPGITCLGDVLADAGYTNHFMGGADGTFANKKLFMMDHGYTDFMDKSTWKAAGETRMNTWGLEDERLFAHAADKVDELRATGVPFNLTMLSVDSHRPGLPGSTCTDAGSDLERAISCSMTYVSGFVRHLEKIGALNDTVVVLMGDHKYMMPDDQLFDGKSAAGVTRTVFNRFWSPEGATVHEPSTDQYAMLPSMLELLGFEVPEGRAGIGVSAVGDHPRAGTLYALDPAARNRLVLAPSRDLYARFWDSP